jgi:hypothetical protein
MGILKLFLILPQLSEFECRGVSNLKEFFADVMLFPIKE